MKKALINGRWQIWATDEVAEWDAITGDASLGTGWEAERLQSMQENLSWGDVVYDIGTEHGWLAAIIAREFVGPQHMVLMEPSPYFWGNIEKVWRYNGFEPPLAVWPGFVGDKVEGEQYPTVPWPSWCLDQAEQGSMPYRYLNGEVNPNERPIGQITVDEMIARLRPPPEPGWTDSDPTALNIDVEGAELLVLQGARDWIRGEGYDYYSSDSLHIWVSIHPDLMEPFGHTRQMVLDFVTGLNPRWQWEHLATDHEEHWHAQRFLGGA